MLKFFTWVFLFHFAYFLLPFVFVTFSVCWTVIAILDIAFNNSKVVDTKVGGKWLLGGSMYVNFIFSTYILMIYISTNV